MDSADSTVALVRPVETEAPAVMEATAARDTSQEPVATVVSPETEPPVVTGLPPTWTALRVETAALAETAAQVD
jgi:hypothetical protein